MLSGGFVVWLAYGLSIHNWAMIISNVASLIFMVITIFVALTYRRGGAKRAAACAAALAPAPDPAQVSATADDAPTVTATTE
jgi:hypothetical protein